MTPIQYLKDKGYSLKISEVQQALDLASPNTVVLRNKRNGYTADDVIKLCRYVEFPPVQALVDLGHITAEEIGQFELPAGNYSKQDTLELLDEVTRRVEGLKAAL